MSEPSDGIDASLRDFEPPPSPLLSVTPPESVRHRRGSTASVETNEDHLAPEEDEREQDLLDSDSASAGGYSPPAWRRLGNGDRSSGFWRGPRDVFGGMNPWREASTDLDGDYDSDDHVDDEILERAIRTKLPPGSQSPSKGRSMSPELGEEETMRVRMKSPSLAVVEEKENTMSPPPDNYIRFALRADVQQRTEPIEAVINFCRFQYARVTSTWSSAAVSILIGLVGISLLQSLFQQPARRPVGDLIKVAGIARSFEPLIYYSENAVAHSQDLQATSVAVWDLGESVRISGMRDAESIVENLDVLSETMKTLSLEMTKFFARVDGDIDGVLNVMDWAKMHLYRLSKRPPPSTISSAYDNIHNMLSQARILEDASGSPTVIGTIASHAFGMSNPQREQRTVQRLFTEFLAVLEDSVEAELQHSVSLFALFESVDFHFLNLARTVAREDEAQEEMHADLLASMWTRILGSNASGLRKFEKNRLLLRNVREKTVRNKAFLVEHNGKLLTLKASLESLRNKLVSPLLRGVNSSTLTLDDQIRGLGDVSEYLTSIRRQQRAKVWESLFATDPNRRFAIDQERQSIDGR